MKILFLGDIVGKAGRLAVERYLPDVIAKHTPDFIIANGENAAHGFGINQKIMNDLFDMGVDCITLGNHAFDNTDIYKCIDTEIRIIRPDNISEHAPGQGATVLESTNGHRVLVVNILGRFGMDSRYNNPWVSVDNLVPNCTPMEAGFDGVVVDFHAEATAEKMGMGWHIDGRASLVIGTHTHIPTADTRILQNGTAYQTDAGMCGCYNSIIGMQIQNALNKMQGKYPNERFEPANNTTTISGILVTTNPKTGLANTADRIITGDTLNR